MRACIGVQDRAGESKSKMATMESLAVYFILSEAREKLGFAPEEFGLSDDDAVTIARMFAKCARLRRTNLRDLHAILH
jgi:hypothetical protein